MKPIQLLGAVGTTVVLLAASLTQVASAATPSCALLDDPIHEQVNSAGGAYLTTGATASATATSRGYTVDGGVAFLASTTAGSGLVAVHRLYQSSTRTYLFTPSTTEITSSKSRYGYVDDGVKFYVASADSECTDPVRRFQKSNQHRLASKSATISALTAAGWTAEGTRFFARPAATVATPSPTPTVPTPTTPTQSSKFTFAVIPDTQVEVLRSTDTRMVQRNQWLAQQDVAFAAQTGDLVNWDTSAHEQYARAKTGMTVLHDNGIPYTVAVGNHDTAATGVGGSAAPGHTPTLVRDTSTLNRYFSAADFGQVGGAFEPGKIDNVYATYQAGGKKWMVLTLEFCARQSVVEWARGVVASHPDYNVIVSTHYYLTGSAAIGGDNAGYGATTPQYVYDRLVSQYPNIKMVFSGHVGYAQKSRVDTGVNGNKIYSFLTTFHEGETNPVRMISVDTAAKTVSSKIYAPYTSRTWSEYDQTITGLALV